VAARSSTARARTRHQPQLPPEALQPASPPLTSHQSGYVNAETNRRIVRKLLRYSGKLSPLSLTAGTPNDQDPVRLIPRNIDPQPCRLYSPSDGASPRSTGAKILVCYAPFLVYPSPGGSQLAADLPTRSRLATSNIRTAHGTRGAWYSPKRVFSAILPGLGTLANFCTHATLLQAHALEDSALLPTRSSRIRA
jgi:hypothetical protein